MTPIAPVEGLTNVRDLGGLRRTGGGRTPHGVFWRSENLDRVTARGWDQLHTAGIRTVIDLRQQAERERTPYSAPSWLSLVHVDHDGLANRGFWTDYWDNGLVGTALYYLPHLAAMPERTLAVLDALASAPPGGVLFHCMGGRDRTGLIAMLLLSAAGVDPEDVVGDYMASIENNVARAASENRNCPEGELEQLCHRHGTSTEGAFRNALAGADLAGLLAQGEPATRAAVLTWRGNL
ncbi:MAG TPA: tyrosine-protein phosphatase [Nocardioides sp.]